jgi:cellulose synthase/poly-beta-1,6-N-acetylglucosamine synthase-like glycosyltransferase
VAADPWWRPSVSVVIAARNEAAVLARKLESVLGQRWPRALLEVIVVDDGSRDRTAEIARGFAARAVKLVALSEPAGKATALNLGVRRARGEVLVLTDARQPLDEDALPWLVAPLADPRVGAVSGELRLDRRLDGEGGGLGLYRRLDDAIRRAEAQSGSSVGVTGALWAMRRAAWTPLPPDTILDDLHEPLCVARGGGRVVVEPHARVLDAASPDPARELRRRTRTLAGNLQLVRALPWTLSPTRNPLFFRLLQHKLARLAAPLFLLTAALSNLALVLRSDGTLLEAACFAAQVVGYSLATINVPDSLPPSTAAAILRRAARVCRSFVLLHIAAVSAVWSFLRHQERGLWRDLPRRPSGEARA